MSEEQSLTRVVTNCNTFEVDVSKIITTSTFTATVAITEFGDGKWCEELKFFGEVKFSLEDDKEYSLREHFAKALEQAARLVRLQVK